MAPPEPKPKKVDLEKLDSKPFKDATNAESIKKLGEKLEEVKEMKKDLDEEKSKEATPEKDDAKVLYFKIFFFCCLNGWPNVELSSNRSANN